MATYQCHRYHIVFSTKERQPFIRSEIELEVWAYMASVGKDAGAKMYEVGGVDDHVHILCGIPATVLVSEVVRKIKGGVSHWMRERFGNGWPGWQEGYSSFTSTPAFHEKTRAYIRNQREHHKHSSYEQEIKRIIALFERGE